MSARKPGYSGAIAVDLPRRAAYDVLHEIGASDAYANVALSHVLKDYHLDQRDAGFVTDLVNGSLRYRLTLDTIIARSLNRTLESLDPRVLDVLRMGAYQLLIMQTDPYAAVDTCVSLVASVAGDGPKGLVNAVLRKLSAQPLHVWLERVAPDAGEDPDGFLSVTHSYPRWIVSALRDSLGRQRAAELPALLAASNEPPKVTLVARPGRSTVDELIAEGAVPGRWSPLAAIAPAGNIGHLAAVREGRAGAQDEGSQLVALALAGAAVDGKDTSWVELCAGPGGKIALLAGLAAQRGGSVTGVELHEHRARLIEQIAGGSPGFAGVIVGDAREPLIEPGVDRVLVDAPCTGLGVLRRRPEIRWRRQPSDIPQLAKLQTGLLNAAIDITRPGGVIGYATCSPHLAETDFVVGDVMRKRSDVVVEDARELFTGVTGLGDGPFVRLWPHSHGTDGMFFALLRRS